MIFLSFFVLYIFEFYCPMAGLATALAGYRSPPPPSGRCRLAVRNVLARLDRRLMVVLGPPTIHCTAEALDYAQWFVV